MRRTERLFVFGMLAGLWACVLAQSLVIDRLNASVKEINKTTSSQNRVNQSQNETIKKLASQ